MNTNQEQTKRTDDEEEMVVTESDVDDPAKEDPHEEEDFQEPNFIQMKIERRKQEEKENKSLIGTVATTMESRHSNPKKKVLLWVVGDYLYKKADFSEKGNALHLECYGFSGQCKGRVHIDADTSRVLKFRQLHSCPRDPDLKLQIQMENEMKNLAGTTNIPLKDIYHQVCLKNPTIGKKIERKNMYNNLSRRRKLMMKVGN